MTTIQAQIYGERAEQLAIVYLTRRDDLRVQVPLPDMGIDLLISLLREGQSSGRFFGVVTKAAPSADALKRHPQGAASLLRNAPFPVCQFVFTMDTDNAYWQWAWSPAEDDMRLAVNENPTLATLDNAALEQIIQTVNHWYDQRK